MNRLLRVLDIEHINQLIGDADVALEHYRRMYGVEIEQIYRQRTGPYDNFVFKMGRVSFEVFSPVDPAHSFGRQHRRFGNCWQGCLWRVPDLEEAIGICQANEIPLVDVVLTPERRWAFTDPRATYFSIQLDDRDLWDKATAANAVGITDLSGFTIAVDDSARAAKFFEGLVADVEVIYEEERPALGATAIGLSLGGYELELQSPVREGELSSFIENYRQRIRTATWKVTSLDDAKQHFAKQKIHLVEGDRPGWLAIEPADNLGIGMQFAES